MFLFAGLLYVVTVLFAIMGWFYKYVDQSVAPASGSSSSSSSSSSDSEDEEKKVGAADERKSISSEASSYSMKKRPSDVSAADGVYENPVCDDEDDVEHF